jgi:hypothetical protein
MTELDISMTDAAPDETEKQSPGTNIGGIRPSMEGDRAGQLESRASQRNFGRKVRRVVTAPVRTWRRLLGLLALPCVLVPLAGGRAGAKASDTPPAATPGAVITRESVASAAGNHLPPEAPQAFVDAVLEVDAY